MASEHQLTSQAEGISCFAWNADHSMIAVCPNSNEIQIYGVQEKSETWQKIFTLIEHDLLVSSIDWSPVTNKIVSCSHDRNAFVWTFEDKTQIWKPALVILRIDRAATNVNWSLDGKRFAVASSAKVVPVCMYEPANDWWVSKMIKKHKSTVLCCAFHPTNGQLLATGSSDFKCRIFSTFDADIDGTVVDSGYFPQPLEFGESYAELTASCWVNSIAWSPSGRSLAFSSHDSTLHVATFSSTGTVICVLRLRSLPLTSLVFLSESVLIGGGHDFIPYIFTKSDQRDDNSWIFHSSLDQEVSNNSSSIAEAAPLSGVAAARALFQSKTSRGQDKKTADTSIHIGGSSKHSRAITGISVHGTTLTTSSLDGKIILWDLKLPLLTLDAATLKI